MMMSACKFVQLPKPGAEQGHGEDFLGGQADIAADIARLSGGRLLETCRGPLDRRGHGRATTRRRESARSRPGGLSNNGS